MNYDGSINIDTRVDTKGMKKGTTSITQQMGGVMKAIKGVGAALGLAFSGAAVFGFIKKVLESFDLMSSGVGSQIQELKKSFELFKGAVANAFITAFVALAPYIIMVVNWLTAMLTTLAQIITALFGVQDAMKGVTKNTKDSAKAAKGALAAFDQINVLSQNKDEGGGSDIPLLSIPTDLLEKVQAFKDAMLKFLQPVTDALLNLYEALKPLGKTIWEGLQWAWENILVPLGGWVISDLVPAFLELLAGAADVLNEALIALAPLAKEFFTKFLKPLAEWAGTQIIEFLGWFIEKLHELADWIKDNPEKFLTLIKIIGGLILVIGILGNISALATTIAAALTGVIAAFGGTVVIAVGAVFAWLVVLALLIATIIYVIAHWEQLSTTVQQLGFIIGYYISQAVDTVKEKFSEMWEAIQNAWANVGDWFKEHVTDPIREAFAEALFNIASGFMSVFNGIRDFVFGIVESIIDIINNMVGAILDGMNLIGEGASGLGAIVGGGGGNKGSNTLAPRIPRLATGAVIPPNSEFAAILGDHKSQRELLGPEEMFRRIIREESGTNGGGEITVNIPVYLDSEKIYDGQKRVATRRGTNLVKGDRS